MDYLALPPEINSARIYTGPGATPMMMAASAWASLATEISNTAESFQATVDGLSVEWLGASSLAMISASSLYVSWLATAAQNAAQAAGQAMAAVTAYESVFDATVPPPVIAANRTQLASLVATNFLGINTPAIMATEAQYMEMWAQDVAAMVEYQLASLQATVLAPFTSMVSSVCPVSVTPAVVGLGGGILASGSNTKTTGLAGLLNLLSGSSNTSLGSLLNSTLGNSFLSSGFYFSGPEGAIQSLMSMFGIDSLTNLGQQQNGQSQQQPSEPSGGSGTYPIGPNAPTALAPSAVMGQAPSVGGKLSVPPSWKPSMQQQQVTPLTDSDFIGIPGVPLLGGIRQEKAELARYGIRPKRVVPRHPSAG